MKEFTEADIQPSEAWDGRIRCDRADLIESPQWHHTAGRQQTASGYGNKLSMPYKIRLNGRDLRVYCCIFSNSGTCYVITRGRKVIVDAS